jgi:hypothetical protein
MHNAGMISTRFEAEQRAAGEGALLQTRGELGAFAVTGRDRLAWLNGLVTCEVSKLVPGAGAYGLAVGKTGKIMSELWFLAAEDRVLVGLPKDRLESIREHFDRHLIMEDAEMSEPLDRAFVFAHGPRAAELVAAAREAGADAAMIDWTGRRDAAVILAPEAGLEAVMARLGQLGVSASDEAWEAIRIAWGVPRAGVDFDDQTLPQEASLEKVAVCFNKGCYLGQETVFMLEKRGHAKKKLMRLFVEGDAPVAIGAELTVADEGAVGTVTSAAPALDGVGWLALGFVKYKHAVAYKALSLAGREARVMGPAGELRKAG